MTGWEYLIYAVVMMVVSYALTPKPPKPPPPEVQQLSDIPVAEQGTAIPVLFGTMEVKGPNVTWYGDVSLGRIRSDGGGK